jgi:hypothetical protein
MKSPEQYEKDISEKRLIEATKKGLTGRDGKLAVVLKSLGQPIVHHSDGGGFVDTNYLDEDMWGESIEDARTAEQLRDRIPMHIDRDPELLMMPGEYEEDDGQPYGPWRQNTNIQHIGQFIIGWIFDGLTRGMHLEIKYMEHNNSLTCHYKGYEVFREIRGQLVGYAPLDEWETWVDRLFIVAKEKRIEKKAVTEQEYSLAAKREKTSWWQRFRLRWGL